MAATRRFTWRQWETVLALNGEIVKYKENRGADEVEIAKARFNDYGPLLKLRRYPEARALLVYCRDVFEWANAVYELGTVI